MCILLFSKAFIIIQYVKRDLLCNENNLLLLGIISNKLFSKSDIRESIIFYYMHANMCIIDYFLFHDPLQGAHCPKSYDNENACHYFDCKKYDIIYLKYKYVTNKIIENKFILSNKPRRINGQYRKYNIIINT